MSARGTLYGVGVGPGDPELMSVKAARILKSAPVVAYFAKKFGFFGALGRRTAGPFARSFIAALLPRFAAASAAGGALEGAFVSAGTASGAAFGAAFIAAAGPLIVVWAAHELNKYIDSKVTTPDELNLHQGGRDEGGGIKGWLKRHVRENPLDTAKTFHPFGWGKGKAVGGTIPFGGASIVGESGPEVAHTGALGTTITPLSRAKTGRIGSLDTPNLSGMIHVHVNTSIQINRREIAKAVGDEIAFTKARRGGS